MANKLCEQKRYHIDEECMIKYLNIHVQESKDGSVKSLYANHMIDFLELIQL